MCDFLLSIPLKLGLPAHLENAFQSGLVPIASPNRQQSTLWFFSSFPRAPLTLPSPKRTTAQRLQQWPGINQAHRWPISLLGTMSNAQLLEKEAPLAFVGFDAPLVIVERNKEGRS